MDSNTIFIITFLVVGLAVIAFLFYRKIDQLSKGAKNDSSLLMLQNQINEITKTLDAKLTDFHKSQQQQSAIQQQQLSQQSAHSTQLIQGVSNQSSKIITEITEKLTSLEKTNQQVMNFSEQLMDLKKVLTSQKTRGNLGEAGLQMVLENILPPNAFEMQHRFDDGDVVDAAVITKDGIIPVDAKFSLENYNRILNEDNEDRKKILEKEFKNDLKKRIDETSKYIKPSEGTLDFAFMFIPAEAIYYDLLVNEVGAVKVDTGGLIDYAFKEKRVIIVSPTTFAAYLQTVLQGLRALKIEGQAKEIIKNVERLQRHIISYDDKMEKLGSSLSTTVNSYNSSYKEFKKIDKDVVRITGEQSKIEILEIDRPKVE
ncbi:MAG: DNA recombination protein RmuC [Candidatus Buchananbacteria bacterium]|nr:DNA recombination protein RmuC [Candidatus Buchananbacteria bacterium]